MRRSNKSDGQFSDEELIDQFAREARKVKTHPEASKVSPALMRIELRPNKMPPLVKVPLDDPMSWQHLAIHVRKLILLPSESLNAQNVLRTLAKMNRAAGTDVKSLLADIKKWESTPLFYLGDLDQVEPGQETNPGEVVLLSARVSREGEDPLAGMTNALTSQQMAEIYLNGEIFHSNPDQAKKFQTGSRNFQETCQHSAQLLVRGGAFQIVRVLTLIEKYGSPLDS